MYVVRPFHVGARWTVVRPDRMDNAVMAHDVVVGAILIARPAKRAGRRRLLDRRPDFWTFTRPLDSATLVNRLDDIPAGYHYYSNTAIDLDGDRATMRVMFAYVQPDSEAWPKAWLTGHYDDVVRREHGRWAFERVTITIDIGFAPYARKSEK